ncbi:MAG: protein kinase [Deltaproteobacteria bacterium]|nr:protein kinase [Deltaproteobacteria bacterium]
MTAHLSPGDVIPGTRYRVLSRVGEGAMGAIYAAEHIDLEKRVALKTLLPEIAQVPEAVERFRQEARAASKIGSPYICDVTDFGALPDGQVFFVMEFLHGQSLAQVLDAERVMSPARALPILRQVCKALGAAHDKGIIHLDVKPDNVMLLADQQRQDAVKVVDFGIAGLLDQGGREEKIAGTPEYIPPERATGAGYDHRSDIYSLGVMAYEMLTGQVPFAGDDPVLVLRKQVSDRPRPPTEIVPDLPPRLEQVVLQMLSKDPDLRPQRMDVVEALLCEAQIEGGFATAWDDVLALPSVDDEWRARLASRMPGRGVQRKGLLLAAVGVALLAIFVAVYFGFIRAPREVVVRVPVTNTDEPERVGQLLEKADKAGRAQHFVAPATDSALYYIAQAEAVAAELKVTSLGAQSLRKAYASALNATGDDLLNAGLRDLAIVKYKEALQFRPDDAELARKAELTAAERQALSKRPSKGAPPPAPPPRDELREAATSGFLSAKAGRFSEARLSLTKATDLDKEGQVTARLADALRQQAGAAWDRGDHRQGRSLYQLVLMVDPQDLEAQTRSRLQEPPPAAVAPPVAEKPPEPQDNKTGKASKGKDGRKTKGDTANADEAVARDVNAAAAAIKVALAAMNDGDYAAAQTNFNKALRADPLSGDAVGGLAEVAFERSDYTAALDYARRATRLSPRAPKPHMVLGDAYFKLLRFAEAKTAYETAAQLAGGKNAQITARLARVNAKLAQ